MTRLVPVSRRDLIRRLKTFGFEGPYQVGPHPYMIKESLKVTIPNPHKSVIGLDLLKEIIKQAGISRKEWIDVQ